MLGALGLLYNTACIAHRLDGIRLPPWWISCRSKENETRGVPLKHVMITEGLKEWWVLYMGGPVPKPTDGPDELNTRQVSSYNLLTGTCCAPLGDVRDRFAVAVPDITSCPVDGVVKALGVQDRRADFEDAYTRLHDRLASPPSGSAGWPDAAKTRQHKQKPSTAEMMGVLLTVREMAPHFWRTGVSVHL